MGIISHIWCILVTFYICRISKLNIVLTKNLQGISNFFSDGLAIDSLHEGLKNFSEIMKHIGTTFDVSVVLIHK